MTQEIRLPVVKFKEIKRASFEGLEIESSGSAIDIVASTVLINEKDEIVGRIVGIETDCPYTPMEGCGCYIQSLEYAANLPPFSIGDLIQALTYGALYGQFQTENGMQYKYNYLWFDLNSVNNSHLLSFYGNNIQEVFTDGVIHVYSLHIR